MERLRILRFSAGKNKFFIKKYLSSSLEVQDEEKILKIIYCAVN